MAVLELCLLSMLSIQAPATQEPVETPRAADVIATNADPAAWLPANTLCALVLRTGDGADTAALWQRLCDASPMGNTATAQRELQSLLTMSGLSPTDLETVAKNGVAIGLTGFGFGAKPQFVCVANLVDTSQQLRQSLTTMARGSFDGVTLQGGITGDWFILASDNPTLAAARAATRRQGSGGLLTDPEYRAALTDAPLGTPQSLGIFVRPAALFSAVLGSLTFEQRDMAGRIGEALAIDSLERAIFRVGFDGDGIDAAASCSMPAADSPLANLFRARSPLTADLARLVPTEAIVFSFSSTDLGGFLRQALDTVGKVEPGAGMMVSGMLAQFGEGAGVDIKKDIIAAITGQSINVTLASGDGMMLGVDNGMAFAAAVDKLLEAGGMPIRSERRGAATHYRVDPAGGISVPLDLAIVGNWICLAEDSNTLATLTRQVTAPRDNPRAAAALQAARPNATMVFASSHGASGGQSWHEGGQARFVAGLSLTGQSRKTALPGEDGAAAVATTDTAPQHPAPAELVQALQQAESDPNGPIDALQTLATADHAGVAARATWLLGQRDQPETRALLGELLDLSPHAEVRLQAMHALLRAADQSTLPTAINGLDDDDVRVRTLAAQLLGKLRQAKAAAPLLAMLTARAGRAQPTTPTTDMQAALLALGDMQSTDHLLPAAEAMDKCQAKGAGHALAFCFQNLSPNLTASDEATLLMAVLDHREVLLRRYAIGRLGELRDPSTAKALEGRLATEGAELRPLVEVALNNIRRHQPGSNATDTTATASSSPWQQVVDRWNGLDNEKRMLLGGLASLCLLSVLVLLAMVSRRRRVRRAEQALALASHSDEYLADVDQHESDDLAEAADELIDESGEDYYDDKDVAGDAAFEAEDEDEFEDEGEFDTGEDDEDWVPVDADEDGEWAPIAAGDETAEDDDGGDYRS